MQMLRLYASPDGESHYDTIEYSMNLLDDSPPAKPHWFTDAQSAQPAANKPLPDAEVRARADALLATMTPEEKAGQITQYFNFGFNPAESKRVQDELAAGRWLRQSVR